MNSSKLTHRPLPAQATNLQPRAVQVRSPCRPTNEILGALLHDAASRCTPLLLAGLVSLSTPSLAALAAEDSSSSGSGTGVLRGFAQFYRSRQQSNGGQLFLGPIQLSRQRLEAALGALRSKESEDVYDAALTSLRSASMQCHGPDLTSATFQEYKLGDPCKLRLVVKNATTLTKDAALVTEAETLVSKIVRQFQLADDMIDLAKQGDAEAAKAVEPLLRDVLQQNIKLEATVKQCLGLAA